MEQDTYTLLREFADSWFLLAMVIFFAGIVAFVFRPGSRKVHRDIADIPLRDDDLARLKGGRDDAQSKRSADADRLIEER